jgi:hypothetical protein
LSRVYIGKGYEIMPATATVNTYLPWPPGQREINRNDPIWFMSPKVAKASTVKCRCSRQFR